MSKSPYTLNPSDTNRITAEGFVVSSSDPTISPTAKPSEKILGDIKGAASGVLGSLEAAAGTVLGNATLQEKGFEKMSAEDHRIGAKSGVMSVGSGMRNTTVEGPGLVPTMEVVEKK